MGNVPSIPAPIPIPVPIPVNDGKKNYRKFREWGGKQTEKIINDYLIL